MALIALTCTFGSPSGAVALAQEVPASVVANTPISVPTNQVLSGRVGSRSIVFAEMSGSTTPPTPLRLTNEGVTALVLVHCHTWPAPVPESVSRMLSGFFG